METRQPNLISNGCLPYVLIVVSIGLLPVVAFGIASILAFEINDSQAWFPMGVELLLSPSFLIAAVLMFCAFVRAVLREAFAWMRYTDNQYQQFAELVGGRMKTPFCESTLTRCLGSQSQCVTFPHSDREARLEVILSPSKYSGVENRPYHTRLTFPVRMPDEFHCRVEPVCIVSKFRDWLGKQRLQFELEEFNKSFVVTANDHAQVRQILNGRAQSELLSLSNWADTAVKGAPMFVVLEIDSRTVTITVNLFLTTTQHLFEFAERGKRMVDALHSGNRRQRRRLGSNLDAAHSPISH